MEEATSDGTKCTNGTLKHLKEKIKIDRERKGLGQLYIDEETPRKYKMTEEEKEKEEKRKSSNRNSAKMSRARQKAEIEKYEKEFEELQEYNMDLDVMFAKLCREKQQMMQALEKYMPRMDIQNHLNVALQHIKPENGVKSTYRNRSYNTSSSEDAFIVLSVKNDNTLQHVSGRLTDDNARVAEDNAAHSSQEESVVVLSDSMAVDHEVHIHSEGSENSECEYVDYTANSMAETSEACRTITDFNCETSHEENASNSQLVTYSLKMHGAENETVIFIQNGSF